MIRDDRSRIACTTAKVRSSGSPATRRTPSCASRRNGARACSVRAGSGCWMRAMNPADPTNDAASIEQRTWAGEELHQLRRSG